MLRLLLLGGCVGWLLVALPLQVHAEISEADEVQARAHFQSGTAYFERGEYEDAIREFQRAFALSPRPQLQYNLYLAHERLGELDEAGVHLSRYLSRAGEIPNRSSLEARLRNLRKRRADKSAEAPLPISHEPSPESGTSLSRPRPLGAIVAWSAAGVGLVTFGVFGALAALEDRALDDACGKLCSDRQVSTLGTYTLIADIGLGVAAAGALTGLVLWTRHKRGSEARARVTLSPAVSPTHTGLRGEVRF
jgi:tetratricopeptide (TPR) repeat protein